MMGAGQLSFENVTCTRGERVLFSGLSFALAAGDAAIVTGPNGVGKSSLIRMAADLLVPSGGTVRRAGRQAFVDDAHCLDIRTSLGNAVRFWAKLDGGNADAALAEMELTHLVDVPARILSTGQRKRAALARVIAARADIWLLDEPANGLDTASIALLETAMAAHRARGGIILTASHLPLALPDVMVVAL
jgi:heme exporter protein A